MQILFSEFRPPLYIYAVVHHCTINSKINGTPKGVTAKIECRFEMGK